MLSALLLVFLMVVVALGVDIGYLCLIRTELQRSADASALAGAAALYDPPNQLEVFEFGSTADIPAARNEAQNFVRLNGAGRYKAYKGSGSYLDVDQNVANAADGDVVLGKLFNPSNQQEPLLVTEVMPNSVQVNIPFSQQHKNGWVPLFFARVIGITGAEVAMKGTATVYDTPTLLPITTSLPHWNSLGNSSNDEFSYEDGKVVKGKDDIPEISIFPGTWNGEEMPPGNFGTVVIGADQGTTTLREQIDVGPDADDFDFHGGKLYAGMTLEGETGISADIETAFVGGKADGQTYSGIIGKTRYIPLYNLAEGNGSNAKFTIEKFVAVRIMHADIKSGKKRVVVQPMTDEADLVTRVRLTR